MTALGMNPSTSPTSHDYEAEHAVVARIRKASGVSSYVIAKKLNAEGTLTRYGKEFATKTVQNILNRPAAK